MKLLRREFRSQILHVLSEQYPATVDLGAAGLGKDGRKLAYNLACLEENRWTIIPTNSFDPGLIRWAVK